MMKFDEHMNLSTGNLKKVRSFDQDIIYVMNIFQFRSHHLSFYINKPI